MKHPLDQEDTGLIVEWSDSENLTALGQGRTHVVQFGPRHADDEKAETVDAVAKVLDEIEKSGGGPLDVVEHDQQRSLSSDGFEEKAYRHERLLYVRVSPRQSEDRHESIRGANSAWLDAKQPSKLAQYLVVGGCVSDLSRLSDDFGDRPEGDPSP